MTSTSPDPIAPGSRIGPYEVVAWLGAGGMGVVYRARDARLGRDVAIKLIPLALAGDESRVNRFEQEARATGQLSHPNILAVYDVGIHAGAPYIVSELLEGESLRARLSGGPLAPRKAVDYARQTAHGLAAAHEKGIVHRDIKPDNLFITTDGRVKILDFGIAKLTRPAEETHTGLATETATGVVMGTAGYMSPEQVRGEPIDPKSDIFSLGAVLHEMLTGRSAFTRDTVADTMAAILKEEPREALGADVPPALERIVARCLEKSRETRYQSARDLAFGLEVLSDTGAAAMPNAVAAAPRPWRARIGISIATLGVLAAGAVWLTWRPAPALSEDPLINARFSRLTDWPGTEAGAEISPDGRFVAFVSDRDGELDLFLSQVGTGRFTNLTREIAPLSLPGGTLKVLGFSGDGGEVWFAEAGDAASPKWLMPLTGGPPRAFLRKGAAAPSWSPDDRRLAYFINGPGDPFYLADRTGADEQPLAVDISGFFKSGFHNHNPAWSPDGQWIYFSHGPEPTEEMNVWRVRPSGGTPEQLTSLNTAANLMTVLDPRTVLYVARREDGSGPWLWSLDVDTRVTRRVTSGLEHYLSVSASRDGRRVVATVAEQTVALWRVPVLDRLAEDHDVQAYPLTNPRAFAPRFRNESMFFLSDRGAGDGLWLARNGQTTEVWSAPDASVAEPAALSPDGLHVAIVVKKAARLHLSIIGADGTGARTISAIEVRGSGGQGTADWSPDGAWIVAAGTDAQGPGLFKIPVNGGAHVRLVDGPVLNPIWSPDGSLIVYAGPSVGGRSPLLGVRPDGGRVELPAVLARLGGGHRFLRNGNVVYLPHGQSMDFWLLDLAAGTTRALTSLGAHGSLNTFDITPDGKEIIFDRLVGNSDIYLIDLPKSRTP